MKTIFIFFAILIIGVNLSGCCSLCQKSTTIQRDTLKFAVHDTTNFVTTPQIKWLTDSIIQFHPFEMKFDTVIKNTFLDRVKYDTLKIRYNFPQNRLEVVEKRSVDTLVVYKEKITDMVKIKPTFFEEFKAQIFGYIFIAAIFFFLGFLVTRKI